MAQTQHLSIDSAVLAGFVQRFQQVFNCKCAVTYEFEKTKVLERIFGQGQPLEYPYAWFEIQSIGHNKEWYSTQLMVRKGRIVTIDSGSTVQRVRIMPANFDLGITYVTNKFDSVEQGSITAFARRWLLAYRGGYLKFTINYGNLVLNVALTMPETLTIPTRENVVETETSYKLTTNLTLHGYISEPIFAQGGKINTINVNSSIPGVNLKTVGSQFLAFPASESE